MTHPHPSPQAEQPPPGFSYEPGNMSAPVTGVPYREGMGFVVPNQAPRRPGTITGAMVLLWVLAGLTVVAALLMCLLVLVSASTPTAREGSQTTTVVTTSSIVTGVLTGLLLLSFAAALMVSAIRLPKKADSARVLALTLMGFLVFTNVSYIVITAGTLIGHPHSLVPNLIGVFLSLLVAAAPAVVIVLLSLKKSVAWFYDKVEGPR